MHTQQARVTLQVAHYLEILVDLRIGLATSEHNLANHAAYMVYTHTAGKTDTREQLIT